MPGDLAPGKISPPVPRPSGLRRFVLRTLTWFRLVDEDDGQLSLTNLAVWVALGKLVFVAAATVLDLGTFSGAMLAYGYKAHRKARVEADVAIAEATAAVATVTPDLGPTVAKVESLAATMATWEGKLEALGSTIKMSMTGRR